MSPSVGSIIIKMCRSTLIDCLILYVPSTIFHLKRGSSVGRHLPLVLEVPGSILACGEENFGVRTPLVSLAGMTLDKCIVLRIGMLTGCPLCRESHPLCRLKSPTGISIWLLVGFHPATRSVQSTPADNTQKRVWQYIEKERKKNRDGFSWVEPVLS